MDKESTKGLNLGKLYVCCCDGIGCSASTKATMKLAKLGLNVKQLIGGLDWWKRDGYSIAREKSPKGLYIKCACKHQIKKVAKDLSYLIDEKLLSRKESAYAVNFSIEYFLLCSFCEHVAS